MSYNQSIDWLSQRFSVQLHITKPLKMLSCVGQRSKPHHLEACGICFRRRKLWPIDGAIQLHSVSWSNTHPAERQSSVITGILVWPPSMPTSGFTMWLPARGITSPANHPWHNMTFTQLSHEQTRPFRKHRVLWHLFVPPFYPHVPLGGCNSRFSSPLCCFYLREKKVKNK